METRGAFSIAAQRKCTFSEQWIKQTLMVKQIQWKIVIPTSVVRPCVDICASDAGWVHIFLVCGLREWVGRGCGQKYHTRKTWFPRKKTGTVAWTKQSFSQQLVCKYQSTLSIALPFKFDGKLCRAASWWAAGGGTGSWRSMKCSKFGTPVNLGNDVTPKRKPVARRDKLSNDHSTSSFRHLFLVAS